MKQRSLLHTLLCLLLISCMLFLCACPGNTPDDPNNPDNPDNPDEPGNNDGSGTEDTNVIYGNGAAITGAGDQLAADSPALTPLAYDEGVAQDVPTGNFWRVISSAFAAGKVFRASGSVHPARISSQTAGKPYDAKGSVLLVPNGLELSDNTDLTLKNALIVGSVAIKECTNLIFENVQIIGDLTVDGASAGVVLNGCRLTGATAVKSAAESLTVMNSYVGFTAAGILSTGAGLTVQNCRLEGAGTAISTAGEDNALKYNTLTLGQADTGIAVAAGAMNTLAAMNVVTGAQASVSVDGARNTVVVRNSLISVKATANRNLYICDNELGGRVEASRNNYFLADGNTYPQDGKSHTALQSGNQNTNGDTLMNVDARLEVGADEALLPHVDKDQFIGMTRKTAVKDIAATGGMSVYTYVDANAAVEPYVFVPPGAYTETASLRLYERHKNTTIYAYGVYVEMLGDSFPTHLAVYGSENITFKGITCGYKLQSCGQVYVLEKLAGNRVRVVTGAGMMHEFGDTNKKYFDTKAIGYQRAGDFYALTDTFQRGITKQSDTMIVTIDPDVYDIVKPGDLFTCRYTKAEVTVSTSYSSNILYKDLVAYGVAASGCFMERENETAVTYYRVADTTRSGEVIEKDVYDRYMALSAEYSAKYGGDLVIDFEISRDEWGNYRGSPAHIGSIDATHAISCLEGSHVISSIFENMCDDGTNQKSNHARLYSIEIDEEKDIATVTYKPNFSEADKDMYGDGYAYKSVCPDFREGDLVFIYTAAGRRVCEGKALSTTVVLPDTIQSTFNGTEMKLYQVTVPAGAVNMDALEGYDLMDDSWESTHKVLVDNRSRASSGFLFDNMLIQNVRSRGLLIKSSDGVIKNCTVRNIAKLAFSVLYEIYYGESGVTENVTITRNLIDNVGFGLSENGLYYHYPIGIQGLGSGTIQEDYLLCKDIEISYNKIINTVKKPFVHMGDTDASNYAIYLRNVRDVRILGNDFGIAIEHDECFPMLGVRLDGAMNIEISRNTYAPFVTTDMIVGGAHYKTVYGTDVMLGEIPIYTDKE